MLYDIAYTAEGRRRSILSRASVCEMDVPYGDPAERHFRKNAFDIGEYGIGTMDNPLVLGCDCLGTMRYFDANLVNAKGEVTTIKNPICLYEEDHGLLLKHTDWRTGEAETRRSQRLSMSFIATVGNYEYGFFWCLYQDGTIQCEVKLTGIMNTTSLQPGEKPEHGVAIAPQLNAPFHQHIFAARLLPEVDGPANSVYEVNTVRVPRGGDGLPKWTAANRSIVDAELAVWYVFGHNYVPRPEDWPVMPVATLGFSLKPDGFFARTPAMDVPPPV